MSRSSASDTTSPKVRVLRPRTWPRWVAIAGVALVPLAFVGLFAGSLSQADKGLDKIPAAIVNDDAMITQTAADGTKSYILAGRLLVTQLTASDNQVFDWTITNSATAAKQLKNGEVYAVLTIPKDFSKSITSLQGDDPTQAQLAITTDDAHSYLAGTVTQSVGTGMVAVFGNDITKQYVTGIYSSIAGVGSSLTQAADGADQLSGGAAQLSSGLTSLASGASSASSGAQSLSSGVNQYTGGVDSLASGLSTLATQSAPLTGFANGIPGYTAAVGSSADLLAPVAAKIAAGTPLTADDLTAIATASGTLGYLDTQQAGLNAGAAGVNGVIGGIGQLSSGASSLSAGSPGLRSGAASLASGVGQLSSGASQSSTGASELATGAGTLASGLTSGAGQVPSMTEEQIDQTSDVVSDPVGLTVTRINEISSIGQVISTFFIPIGLWVGALAAFLIIRPATRSLLGSSASSGRILLRSLARVSALAVAQALLLVLTLHVAFGVSWSLLGATTGMAIVIALAFTAFHYLLTLAFGRAGLIISLLLLAIQLTASGGLYPIELVATPFQTISPYLPLSYAVNGMQAVLAGGSASTAISAVVALVLLGAVSVGISYAIIARRRGARALGLIPAISLQRPKALPAAR